MNRYEKMYLPLPVTIILVIMFSATSFADSGYSWEQQGSIINTNPVIVLTFLDAVYIGSLTVQDVSIDLSSSFFNPFIGAEYRFNNRKIGVGLEYHRGENDFDGEYIGTSSDTGLDRKTEGDITLNRKRLDAYIRFLPDRNFNFKLSYRYYKLKFKNGHLVKREKRNGTWEKIEEAINAEATGNLTKGLDAEFNGKVGSRVRFCFQVGLSYFFSGDYEYYYDRWEEGDPEGSFKPYSGKATYNSYAVRLIPGLTVDINDSISVLMEYQFYASIWEGDVDKADIEDFPGVEVSNALIMGVVYNFDL